MIPPTFSGLKGLQVDDREDGHVREESWASLSYLGCEEFVDRSGDDLALLWIGNARGSTVVSHETSSDGETVLSHAATTTC
ncbi:uncharacterized protein Z518_00961 [Rhinocladiella mackenziei CBS 650.93]|uniref:Uncharacterized protein n=1 Tax=Rhinocladiella mackenziei CBS 650.93 TaxID=1442369 RepID=A0A0D2JK59_9EURO|nr:uncharacterized protein Z518_00961 [Rhinocladiella mackenziei CBS 650.93]KIX09880.1 hypothetical protein Z518_00961 [Rhinocladiella mackenziei CBS 650.93]